MAEGCTKSTVSLGATLKLFQVSDKLGLVWLTVVVVPDCAMLPEPDATTAPIGPACATTALKASAAATSVLSVLLPCAHAISDTATHASSTWLQTIR